eukprot:Gb_08115 [translate_table: standard]
MASFSSTHVDDNLRTKIALSIKEAIRSPLEEIRVAMGIPKVIILENGVHCPPYIGRGMGCGSLANNSKGSSLTLERKRSQVGLVQESFVKRCDRCRPLTKDMDDKRFLHPNSHVEESTLTDFTLSMGVVTNQGVSKWQSKGKRNMRTLNKKHCESSNGRSFLETSDVCIALMHGIAFEDKVHSSEELRTKKVSNSTYEEPVSFDKQPPHEGNSCGLSCHLECALQHKKIRVVKIGQLMQLGGRCCYASCGRVNGLIGYWRKQLSIAKDARRVDILFYRLSLSQRLLNGTCWFKELHDIMVKEERKLEEEVGPINGVPPKMAQGIIIKLSTGLEVKFFTKSVELFRKMIEPMVIKEPLKKCGSFGVEDFGSNTVKGEILPNDGGSSFKVRDPNKILCVAWIHATLLKATTYAWAHMDIRRSDVVAWPTNLDAKVTMLNLVPRIIRACISSGEASSVDEYLWLMGRAYHKPVIAYCGGTEIGGGFVVGSMLQAQSLATFNTPAMGCTLFILGKDLNHIPEQLLIVVVLKDGNNP